MLLHGEEEAHIFSFPQCYDEHLKSLQVIPTLDLSDQYISQITNDDAVL